MRQEAEQQCFEQYIIICTFKALYNNTLNVYICIFKVPLFNLYM